MPQHNEYDKLMAYIPDVNAMPMPGPAAGAGGPPPCPAEMVPWLMARAGLCPGAAVAEVGSGSGAFTRPLLAAGLRVYALEPNPHRRRRAEAALGGVPGFVSAGGLAEDTGLPAGSVRLVVAANAFQYFSPAAFAAECRRLLGPGGLVALVWTGLEPQELTGKGCQMLAEEFIGGAGGSTLYAAPPACHAWPAEGALAFCGHV